MTKTSIGCVLAVALSAAGCAARHDASPATTAGAGAAEPRPTPSAPPKPAAKPPAAEPLQGTGSSGGVPSVSVNPSSPTPAAPAADEPPEQAPPATASAYVYTPQQAVSARPPSAPAATNPGPSAVPPAPGAETPSDEKPEGPRREPPPQQQPPGEIQLAVAASAAEIARGEIVTLDVIASSSTAVVDAPFHLNFDPAALEFVDSAVGDFLTQGGSSVVFFADGHSRPGDVAVAAGRVLREEGASGSGLLCRIRLRGVGSAATPVLVGRAKAWGTHGEELTVLTGGTTVVVR